MLVCKTCKANKPFSDFGKYTIRGKTRYRKSCKPCRVKEVISVYHSNPKIRERVKLAARASHLRNKYSMTEEDLTVLIENQNNQCAICHLTLKKPNIDHDHVTGKIRGILCWDCNIGLGKFKDNVKFLESAVLYLKKE